MDQAARVVKVEGKSIRSVATEFGICHVSLHRYCKKLSNFEAGVSNELPTTGYNPHSRVFHDKTEAIIVTYLLKSSEIYYGLTSKEVRRFAYISAFMPNICQIL